MLRRSWSSLLYFVLLALLFLTSAFAGALLQFWSLPVGNAAVKEIREWLLRDGNLKIAGLLVTISLGVIPLVRNWSYWVDRLPAQLKDYLDLCQQTLLRERDLLIDAVASPTSAPKSASTWWEQRQQRRNRHDMAEYTTQLDRAPIDPEDESRQLTIRLKVTEKAHAVASFDKATHHYVRALDYLRLADSGHEPEATRDKALAELKHATQLDTRDFRLHRAYVRQLEGRGQTDELDRAITDWIGASKKSQAHREHGIAQAFRGARLFEKSKDPSLTLGARNERLRKARDMLETAWQLIQGNPPKDGEARTDQELAKALECLVDVQVRRSTPALARTSFTSARRIYSALADGIALPRLDKKLADLGVDIVDPVAQPLSPQVAIIRARIALGRAHQRANDATAARHDFANARTRLSALTVPEQISAQLKEEFLAELAELAEFEPT
jgi:hypothetical protein